MTVNTRLQENPALQRMPTTQREWTHYQNELAKWVRYVVQLGDGSITTEDGDTISGLDEMPGQLASQDSLNTISAFNKNSVQSVIPLSAIDAGSSATINIAAHDVHYGGNVLSYGSGSIAGLGHADLYYVYADDADKTGGAVTYVASTTATDIMGSTARYFVGQITTPADGAGDTSGGWGGGVGDSGSQVP